MKIPPSASAVARLLLLSLLVASTCSSCRLGVAVNRGGKTYPPLPDDCPIRFSTMSARDADARYERLGTLTVYFPDRVESGRYTSEIRRSLRPKVCELGGGLVVPAGSYQTGPGSYVAYRVYRRRSAR